MNLPPCTLVTACYDMRPYNPNHARSVEDTMRGLEVLLHVPAYMIIHCDPFYAPLIQQRRAEIGFGAITRYEVASFEQLWAAKFVVQVKQNRAQYWPTRDQRTCAESHLLCCNKFDLVQQAIRTNPFSTPLFGWIDANLATAHAPNIKIAEQYTPNMVPWLLHRIPDRLFHIQVLNVEEKRFCDPEHWREYYAQYRWVVCGSFFVCGADVGMRVLDRLKDVMIQHTMSGYGHAEETVRRRPRAARPPRRPLPTSRSSPRSSRHCPAVARSRPLRARDGRHPCLYPSRRLCGHCRGSCAVSRSLTA